MAFSDNKITQNDITDPEEGKGVQTQPNKLTGNAQANKKVFDALVEEVVMPKFNALIDELLAQTAAGQIGCSATGVASTTVNAALAEIYALITTISQGEVPNGSITTIKLADANVTAAKLTGILPANVGIKMGTAVPTADDISEGEIYLKYSV